jgi:hypothetical protein
MLEESLVRNGQAGVIQKTYFPLQSKDVVFKCMNSVASVKLWSAAVIAS